MEAQNGDSNNSKMEDYQIVEQIGRGSFGAAFLVLHKNENKKYVLKKISISKQSEKLKRTAHHEMNLIAKLHHPYIVEYKDAWVEKERFICIVTHYCEGGDISTMIKKARGAYFSEEILCKWLTQLLLAVDYLHSNRVLHQGLKLSNIFVTKQNDIRLGDFGLSKLLDGEARASSVAGTPNYICPELLSDMPYGYKSDIWSLGCCMFEIAAHHQAFRAPDMSGLINKINRSLISPLPIVYPSTLKQIIKSMLRKSPEHRPTAAELLRHSYLEPFLLKCHNPNTVFLPVKSPSPTNIREKSRNSSSPKSPCHGKYQIEKEPKLKQRELLPLFDEHTLEQYPNLLDDESLTEEKLETKRVDPTSYSGEVSHDSEDSKSGDTNFETPYFDSPSLKGSIGALDSSTLQLTPLSEEQECSPEKVIKSEIDNVKSEEAITEPPLSNDMVMVMVTNETEGEKFESICSPKPASFHEDDMTLNEASEKSNFELELRSPLVVEETSSVVSGSTHDDARIESAESCANEDAREVGHFVKSNPDEKEGVQVKNEGFRDDQIKIPLGLQRADALESLLELCARLMKQDKFDELKGVLKPFGDDIVSSRETAIWLTKSLINAQKLAKES